MCDLSDQLAVKALNSSTQDREEEDKKHVLAKSKCCSGKIEDQNLCSCKDGALPCYWSSCASNDANSNEWIALRLSSMVCLVHSITILPYQAWWQVPAGVTPPVYAPREAYVEFGALGEGVDDDGRHVIMDRWRWSAASSSRPVPHNPQVFICGPWRVWQAYVCALAMMG